MEFKRTLPTYLLILVLNRFTMSAPVDRLDELLVKATPIGDNKIKLTSNATEYIKICDDIKSASVNPVILINFAGTILKIREFRESVISLIKERMKNRMCDLAKEDATEWAKNALQINAEMLSTMRIRQKYTNAMVAAAKPKQTEITSSHLGCFILKWVDETLEAFQGETSKEVMQAQLEPYKVLTAKLKPRGECDWDDFPEAKNTRYRSLELLFFEAGKNVLLAEMYAAKAAAKGAGKPSTTTKAPGKSTKAPKDTAKA